MNEHIATRDGDTFDFDTVESRYRCIVDDFLSPEVCNALVKFADEHAVIGDGYGGNPHPHTPNETFSGYSIGGATDNATDPGHLLTLQTISDVRKLIMQHYGLRFLWLEYAHLVVRESTGTGAEAESEEFSHPWHFDNQHHNIRHRSHTAILYLNDGFEGGLTRFREASFGPFREVAPRAGRLVTFDAAENAHAVSKLVKGRRYVLNMWFAKHWRRIPKHRRIFKPL